MTGRVVVVGLGPGDSRLVSVAAETAIAASTSRFVRTTRHPSASLVEPATSFDWLYERAGSIEEVYAGIVDELVASACAAGSVLYAVPGSPLVAERTVELLRADPRVEVEIVPGLSFLDLAWDRLGVDPVGAGVRLIDGHRFAVEAAGQHGTFLVAQCDSRSVLSEIKLAVEDGPDVVVLQRLGLPDEAVTTVAWADLDRAVDPDHLTCLWIPALGEPVAAELVRFTELVRTLRARCPWDQRQTHRSLTRHLLEETYEVLEAIDELEAAPKATTISRRNSATCSSRWPSTPPWRPRRGSSPWPTWPAGCTTSWSPAILTCSARPGQPMPNWEELKKAEKGRASVMDGVPGNLPSLLYAYKLQGKAASVGFDWKNAAGAWPKILEELDELEAAIDAAGEASADAVNEELGDVLFSVVNVARHLGLDPESALRESAAKFRSRFQAMEELAGARHVPIDDDLWDEVKASARPGRRPDRSG